MEDLILAWQRAFGDAPVDVRRLIEEADHDPELAAALLAVLPAPQVVDPAALRALLARHENRSYANFRLARAGHRWRVAPALSYVA